MQEDWEIREYRQGDEGAINALFNSIFEKSRTMEQWTWEFKKNPQGINVLVTQDSTRIFGHLASLNRTIRIGSREHLSSLEVDGMTHPDYARQGVFVALGKELLSRLGDKGFVMAYGFPNERAQPGHKRLGAIEVFTPRVLIRPINLKRISKKMFTNGFLSKCAEIFSRLVFGLFGREKKIPIRGKMEIAEISNFDEKCDVLWEKAGKSHNLILKRDSTYLNWRYAGHPEKPYRMFAAESEGRFVGWVVFRIMDRFDLKNGAIVDMLALPGHEDAIHALVLTAVHEMKKENADLIACLIPEGSPYFGVLRKCGFVNCPERLNPNPRPLIIYPLSDELDMNVINNPRNWYITWGDTDVM
jgi:hypothetical protein